MRSISKILSLTVLLLGVFVFISVDLGASGTSETTRGNGLADGSGQGQGNGRGQGQGQGYGRGRAVGQGNGAQGQVENEDLIALVQAIPSSPLSETEKNALIFMWEEEKLARDVYTALYKTWNLPVFQNIAASEQNHMDSVRYLIERYKLSAPNEKAAAGVFTDKKLAGLYTSLIAQGKKSLGDALKVGATIEDLDLADLDTELGRQDNADIGIIFQNLAKGSRNHLRSFIGQLERSGLTYTPQYISSSLYKTILAVNREIAPITDPKYTFK